MVDVYSTLSTISVSMNEYIMNFFWNVLSIWFSSFILFCANINSIKSNMNEYLNGKPYGCLNVCHITSIGLSIKHIMNTDRSSIDAFFSD